MLGCIFTDARKSRERRRQLRAQDHTFQHETNNHLHVLQHLKGESASYVE